MTGGPLSDIYGFFKTFFFLQANGLWSMNDILNIIWSLLLQYFFQMSLK